MIQTDLHYALAQARAVRTELQEAMATARATLQAEWVEASEEDWA